MTEGCLFCRIVAGEISSDIVYQDEKFLAFRDVEPQAPKHVLVVPKIHITSLTELAEGQQGLIGSLIVLAKNLAEKEGIARTGYRLVINCGYEGGQAIPHLHIHLIGGRRLSGLLG